MLLSIWYGDAILISACASLRSHDSAIAFVLALLLSPPVALLIILCTSPTEQQDVAAVSRPLSRNLVLRYSDPDGRRFGYALGRALQQSLTTLAGPALPNASDRESSATTHPRSP